MRSVLENDEVTAITTPYFEFFELCALCRMGRLKHMQKKIESYWGGDHKLVENFIGVMKGTATPIGSLKDGIASARLCLAAKKSATEHIFVDINSMPKGE